MTPVEPQVSVDLPAEVQSVELVPAGEVVDEREVARFGSGAMNPASR